LLCGSLVLQQIVCVPRVIDVWCNASSDVVFLERPFTRLHSSYVAHLVGCKQLI